MAGYVPRGWVSAMPRKPTQRDVWCPSCHTHRTTAAMRGTKLRCPGCGTYYRAPAPVNDEELPEGVPAPAGGAPPLEDPPPPDPGAAGKRAGARRARSIGRRHG